MRKEKVTSFVRGPTSGIGMKKVSKVQKHEYRKVDVIMRGQFQTLMLSRKTRKRRKPISEKKGLGVVD